MSSPADRPSAPDDRLSALLGAVRPTDDLAAASARDRWAALAIPPGGLGDLEEIAIRLSGIAGTCPPPVPQRPALIVAAGDHGVHAQGVTQWPQALTGVLRDAVAEGVTAGPVLAAVVGATVRVLDVGVASAVSAHPEVITDRAVPAGTADLSGGPSMDHDQVIAAVLAGVTVADRLIDEGHDLLLTGEVGLANTTAAACLIGAVTGRSAESVVGPGAGNGPETVAVKTKVVAAAIEGWQHAAADPFALLAALGGAEHAALVGVILAGAARRVPVLLDGVNACAAAVVAERLAPAIRGHPLAGHRSTEPGAAVALEHLGLTAMIELGLRLGEGTGAALAVPVVQGAAAILGRMALLEDLAGPPE